MSGQRVYWWPTRNREEIAACLHDMHRLLRRRVRDEAWMAQWMRTHRRWQLLSQGIDVRDSSSERCTLCHADREKSRG